MLVGRQAPLTAKLVPSKDVERLGSVSVNISGEQSRNGQQSNAEYAQMCAGRVPVQSAQF